MKKIQIIPTRERIANQLKDSILNGDMKANSELIQTEVADMLGVSRIPVREAFLILENDGFIHRNKSRSFVVSEFTLDDVYEHYEIRSMLEGNIAFRLALSKPDTTALKAELKAIDDNDDAESFSVHNTNFHEQIWKLVDLKKHEDLVRQLWNRIPHLLVAESREHRLKANEEHYKIIEAIDKGDAQRAREAMQAHILRSMADYVARVDHLKAQDK